MTTANKITLMRIVMIPIFVMLAIYYGHGVQTGHPQAWQRWGAITVFVLAAASDGVDGYIARHYNQKSRLGVLLDPIADKGLLLAGILTLSFGNWSYELPIWFAVLVIARDVIVVSGALTLHFLNGSVRVRPSWTGKSATAFQMIALVMAMLQSDFLLRTLVRTPWQQDLHVIDFAVGLAGLFTALSGVSYVVDGIGQIHAKGHGDPKQWSEI